MRIQSFTLLSVLLALLTGCSINLAPAYSIFQNFNAYKDQLKTTYLCTPGVIDGPGLIGGQKVTGKGVIGMGTVFIYQHSLEKMDFGHSCTGTLVGSNMVMTAAHCVDTGMALTRNLRTLLVFDQDPICSVTTETSKQARKIEFVEVHPDWKREGNGGSGDIALIRFEGVAPEGYQPLPIAKDFVPLADETEVFAAGFGQTSDFNVVDNHQPYLRMGRLRPLNKGGPSGAMNNPASRLLVFDQRGEQALCKGDTGGPAMVVSNGHLQVIGVASKVAEAGDKATCKEFVIHTSVTFYREWLEKTYDRMKTKVSSRNPFRR